MAKKENLSLVLARRQKRLLFWRERFELGGLDQEEIRKCKELFSSYSAAIAKMVHVSEDGRQEVELQLESLERELTSHFETRRLMTSSIGVPSVRGE